jgi:general secretion pathway protein E
MYSTKRNDGDRITFIDYLRSRCSLRGAPDVETGHEVSAEHIWRSGMAGASDIADASAEFYAIPRITLDDIGSLPALTENLSYRYLREAFVYPYADGAKVTLALADPSNQGVIKAIGLALGARPLLKIISFEELEILFERTLELGTTEHGLVENDLTSSDSLSEAEQTMQDLAHGAPVVRIIDEILERAVSIGATDVHLETEREQLQVRMRVDGYLRRDQRLPLGMAPAVISRLKILAGLDIADRRLPQDGRSNLKIGNAEADLRVAVMPNMYGETAVLRILLRDTRLLDLDRIGMGEKDKTAFRAVLAEPHGIVVVTGPTGSGKTTTLATALSMLNEPTRKIVTVEDPIEYQIAGVHQTQIKSSIGLTFAKALRSFLRHDPDIIMVGEMRDGETAGIGVQAALTGHLVLTTLHTNSASDAVVRLIDMGVEPYLLSSSLRGVLGQRLVRKLCERCKLPDDKASENAARLAVDRGLAVAPGARFHRAVGCDSCGQSGYRGRIGLFEVLRTDESIRSTLRRDPDPRTISEMARKGGMTSMLEDGFAKAAQGLTTIDEVLRATG